MVTFHSYSALTHRQNTTLYNYCCCCSLLYSAILRSRADSLRSHAILHKRIAFCSAFLTIHRSGVLTALAWLAPHETAAILACPRDHVGTQLVTSCVCVFCMCLIVIQVAALVASSFPCASQWDGIHWGALVHLWERLERAFAF